jgi:hypothetical protein
MSGRAYTRLPGVRRGIFTRSSVWLGADHILLIEGTRINERYQRVYLRDILGMVILRKPRFVLQVQWMFVLPAVLIAAAFVPASWRATSFSIATLVDLLILTALYLTSLRHGCRRLSGPYAIVTPRFPSQSSTPAALPALFESRSNFLRPCGLMLKSFQPASFWMPAS